MRNMKISNTYIITFIVLILEINLFVSCDKDAIANNNDNPNSTIKKDTISHNDSISDSIENRIYYYKSNSIPISEKSFNNIFLGSILFTNSSSLNAIHSVPELKYVNTISMNLEYGDTLINEINTPSLAATLTLFKKMDQVKPMPNLQMTSNSQTISSFRELHLFGERVAGLAFDSIYYSYDASLKDNQNVKSYNKDNITFRVTSITQVSGRLYMDSFDNPYWIATNTEGEPSTGIVKYIDIGKQAYLIESSDNSCCIVTFTQKCEPVITYGQDFTKSDLLSAFEKQQIRFISFSIASLDGNNIIDFTYQIDMRTDNKLN